jgi:hypothetical protein
MARRVKIGDLFELSTGLGLAYAQCTHRHPEFGHLVRVLPGFFEQRPETFSQLAEKRAKFVTFFPLQAAVSKQVVIVVAHEAIPEDAQVFPVFRAGSPGPGGRVETWWLWDGEREWRIGELTDEQRHLPIRGIWNDTLLIERIVSGWLPETDPW